MSGFPNIAPVGSLVGDPTRAAMLAELMDGRALTAGELASRAQVSASTASSHLSRLVGGGLLAVVNQGRHRYFRLAGPDVASALEALATLTATPAVLGAFEQEMLSGLRFARSCYGHLAGGLGVALRDRLLETALIAEDGKEHRVTMLGERWFTSFGIDLRKARRAKRSFARACLDWSERRPHLAGALGDALLVALIERGWIRQQIGERVVELTEAGRAGLAATLGLNLPMTGRMLPSTLSAGRKLSRG